MDSSSSSVPPAATGPSPCEALPLLNRLADFCVVYGVDHLSFVRNNESRNRFSSLHKWVSPWLFVCACVRVPASSVEHDTRFKAIGVEYSTGCGTGGR